MFTAHVTSVSGGGAQETRSFFRKWSSCRMVHGVDRKPVPAGVASIRSDRSGAGVPELHKISGIKPGRAGCSYLVPVIVKRRDHLKFVRTPMVLIVHFLQRKTPHPISALVFPPFG